MASGVLARSGSCRPSCVSFSTSPNAAACLPTHHRRGAFALVSHPPASLRGGGNPNPARGSTERMCRERLLCTAIDAVRCSRRMGVWPLCRVRRGLTDRADVPVAADPIALRTAGMLMSRPWVWASLDKWHSWHAARLSLGAADARVAGHAAATQRATPHARLTPTDQRARRLQGGLHQRGEAEVRPASPRSHAARLRMLCTVACRCRAQCTVDDTGPRRLSHPQGGRRPGLWASLHAEGAGRRRGAEESMSDRS